MRHVFHLGLALASGLLLAMAYPPSPAGALAWIALVPVFFVVSRSRPVPAFLFALLAGLVYYSLAFQWTAAFHRYALPFVSVVSAVLFFGLPMLCIRPFLNRGSLAIATTPSIWVLFEYVKQNWLLQFPFGILGYTQHSWTSLIQIADLGGTALVSWLLVLVNVCLFVIIRRLLGPGRAGVSWRPALVGVVAASAALGASLLYGTVVLGRLSYDPAPRLKVGFAQTFFRPERRGSEGQRERLEKIEEMVRDLQGLGVSLVIFPELTFDSALTYETNINLADNAATLNRMSTLARLSGMNLLFGSLELKERGGSLKTFNAMQMFTPNGDLSDIYRKSVLVPFGETNPFAAVFPGLTEYLRRTTDSVQLDRGDTAHLFTVSRAGGTPLHFGVLICFESAFGKLARRYAGEGADFLVSATDDSWSRSSVAMYQHAVMSIFRAVETRTPVLRVSNGGLSMYADERGRYSSSLPLFSAGEMTSRLFSLRTKRTTLYVRFGDWLVPLSLAGVVAAACMLTRAPRRRAPGGGRPGPLD